MHSPRQLFYVSRARGALSSSDLQHLLAVARRKNWHLGVTGCLLFTGRGFAQVLEGDADALDALMQRIRADPRHEAVTVLLDRRIERRRHPDWSMGYVYSLDLAERIDAWLGDGAPDAPTLQSFVDGMCPDPVMGPL